VWNLSADRGTLLGSAAAPHIGRPAPAAGLTTALAVGRTTLLHGDVRPRGRRTGASSRLRGRLLSFSVQDMTSRGSPPRRPQ
jgi:hypothetical protein